MISYIKRLRWYERLFLLLVLGGVPVLLMAQAFPGQWVYEYTAPYHITYQGNFIVSNQAGRLHTLCVNTGTASGTVTVKDGSSTMAVIDASSKGCQLYDAQFLTNLVVTEGAANTDVTATYQ